MYASGDHEAIDVIAKRLELMRRAGVRPRNAAK
jgi:hypothetical protein